MKITNLRPKNGAYFEISDAGHLIMTTPLGVIIGSIIEQPAVEGCIDFDVVVPEYQVGDLVNVLDTNFDKHLKGLVVDEAETELYVAFVGSDETWEIDKSDLMSKAGRWGIVGLWEEGNND